MRNIFCKNHAENKASRIVADLILFLKKLYIKQKQLFCSNISISQYFDIPQIIKNKLYRTLDQRHTQF